MVAPMPIMRTRLPRVQVVPDTISADQATRAWDAGRVRAPLATRLSYNSERALHGAELYAEMACDRAVADGRRYEHAA
jgi:hypothetical protein